MNRSTISDVENFWDNNPLFVGEVGIEDVSTFFKAHDDVYQNDVFAGIELDKTFYLPNASDSVLDVGCGVGFWLSLFEKRQGVTDLKAVDISSNSIAIAKQRIKYAKIQHANAEKLPFEAESFSFVNCHGVIHHTPETQQALNEIYRVMTHGGRGSVSVYYDNILVRLYPFLMPVIRFFYAIVGKNKGRGRSFERAVTKEQLVKMYDGEGNPIGKSYSLKNFESMLRKAGFKEIYFDYYFFPFRFLKLQFPKLFRSLLVGVFPFMIVANLNK